MFSIKQCPSPFTSLGELLSYYGGLGHVADHGEYLLEQHFYEIE